jgi:glycerol kinase
VSSEFIHQVHKGEGAMRREKRSLNKILAVDVGTQSLRVGVVDRDFRVLEKQQVSYTPQVN